MDVTAGMRPAPVLACFRSQGSADAAGIGHLAERNDVKIL